MHIMTEITILLDRRMLIQKGTLLIGVTLVTEVIHRNGSQTVILSTMRTMTGAALHLAFPYGVVGREFRQHLHLLVAVIAECRIALVQHLCFSYLMGLVALIAAHLIQGVLVSRPVYQRVIAMAGKADSRTLTGIESGKTDDLLDLALRCYVGTARPMASFASACPACQLEGADFRVYCLSIVFEDVLMTNGALFRTDVCCTGNTVKRIFNTSFMGTSPCTGYP